ncbi:UDP-3-O-(3-hydroxymyristoyl)glucosamine N-acyltransferase [Devosia sp. ZB163]|uniref:UDP-3-O-(3-hydroxymyristoyl)glucosamine N-acyltransferase n=1 Tax=Devosia sp. ZB163 TaxID=3025938 RepID=UPI00235DDAFE|nr:UDP-3-O-(3-hydroxymyristoyl)glucosamine N-acyltransferase [Devosia sp. ZB163]MDC9824635.1 UDP-3-O-(3-hydroxymyristoyl)glucosamine N-acyltransferase [Devosia sp. ZB163]
MVDTRFHSSSEPISLGVVLSTLGRDTGYDSSRAAGMMISGAEELHLAGSDHIAFAAQAEYRPVLAETKAGAVIVHPSLAADVPSGSFAIVDVRPHDLFVDLLDRLYPMGTRDVAKGLLEIGGPAPYLEEGVRLGANVVLGPGVEIGRNTIIGPNTVIGRGVAIGRNAVIGPNVTIECAYLGNNVVVHTGARIGTEGFGWLGHGRTNRKVPQLGRAIIQDGVEIGANTTIDRGALGDTVIGEGTKIDNLVQIGHNCHIGRYCLIAAHCGLSGSTVLEDSVLMGGRASTVGHLTVGKGTVIMGAGVATKDIPPGSKVGGYPAQDVRKWWREVATLRRLNQRGLE